MRLTRLLAEARDAAPELWPDASDAPPGDPEVSSVVQDHRRVSPGALFVARRGERFDGHDQVAAAVGAGAVAIVGDRAPDLVGADDLGVPYVRALDAKRAIPYLAAALHG